MSVPRSLILITVDCLRADHVGFMGYTRPTTPFLDSLAKESVVFDNAIVAGAPTYYSFPAIMASRHPLGMGRDAVGLSSADEPTIATALNQIGYATAAFVAGNPYITKHYGYAEGFDVFQDFLDNADSDDKHDEKNNGRMRSRVNEVLRRTSARLGLGSFYDELLFRYGLKLAERSPLSFDQLRRFPSSDVVVSRAGEWLKQRGSDPFFLWLHLMDPHGPYYPPQHALNLMDQKGMTSARARYLNSCWSRAGMAVESYKSIREDIVALYDSGIRWMDQQVANLAKMLQSLGLWDECVFALTADHGEEFLDHNGRLHAPPKVTEELVHVPLLLRVSNLASRRITAPFGLLNLAPTLLDCVHAPLPAEFSGQSYWQKIKNGQDWNDEIIVECIAGCNNPARKKDRQGPRLLAVREARYKLIVDFNAGSEQMFDLQTDPGELSPLAQDIAKPVRRRLLEHACRHIARAAQSPTTRPQIALSLRNLILDTRDAA
ncbi:MAG TPA: sulfatase [Terriglobales bacterium]|nr:sulfatase [Terriglobales bacterium]